MDLRLWLWLIVTFISLRFTVTRRLKNHNSRRGLWAEVQSEMVPYTDDKAILKCLTSSSASIEWLFNGDLISDTDQRFTNEKHKLFVHFKKVPASKWSDNPFKSHKFQCKATLNEETVISEPAKLIITFLDDFDHQNNSVIKTVQGNTAVIPCKPPNSMPSAIMEYYFNQTLISKSEGRYLLNSGNLQILDSQISDSGLYRCVAFNAFLRERRNASWTVELNVQPHNWSKHDAHQSVSFNNDYSAKNSVNFVIKPVNVTKAVMGSNVTLECVADGIKTPKITWFKKRNGVEESLNKKKSRQVAGNLILIAVEENDSGVYVCRATVDNSAIEAHAFVDVQMTPRFIKSLKDTTVNEGEDFTLECQAKGNPNPRINWFFNGKSLNSFKGEPINFNSGLDSESQSIGISFSDGSSKLSIKAASSSIHSGIYQCFASNELLASDYRSISALARVKVLRPGEVNIPKSNSYDNSARSTDSSNANMNSGNEDDLQLATIRPSESGKKRHNELMIPPSKPKIFRLSDDSVMVNWEISSKPSLEVRFFKIQYKVKKSRWNTLPEDIPPYIRSQTVTGLIPDAKYRFRVLAVYVNDDNKESPSSDKFHLIRTSMLKKPKDPPTINAVLPQSHTSIEVFWENHRENATSLEGFFIHYRATSSAGEYFQITVLGSNKLSYTVSNLSPSTSYEFKLQSFNSAGVSDYSKVLTATTFEDPVSTTTEMTNVIKGLDKGLDTRIDNNSDMFLIIVGCIGGFALTVFLVCCLIQCGNRFKQTPQRKKDSQLPQRVNGEINNGSLLHHTTQSIDNYKSETDTLSSHPDKSSINNVTASVSIDHFPVYHEEIRDKKNYQTRTYTIGNYCEDTYTARTGSWSRKSHKKCYEAEAGLKLITTASSHNSLQRKYLYENENLPSTLEKRHQAFKSEEHLKCSLNARIHSKSSSFTKLDGTLERKKRRTATPVATPQPPPIPERQLTVAGHRSLSSSRLNGSLEKRKKSRPDYGNTNTNKNGNKSNESKMNSYNGAISHINTKPPLLIMQSTC